MKKILMILLFTLSTLLLGKEASGGMNRLSADMSDIKYYLNGGQYIGETAKAEQIYTEISQRNLVKKTTTCYIRLVSGKR